MHPTVKPVALVADAMRDCSRRDGIVLDCFGGSDTTLIAAAPYPEFARDSPDTLPLVQHFVSQHMHLIHPQHPRPSGSRVPALPAGV
jgi:hypothetical protein